ncbi:CYTH domain-containing protein [Pseudomonadota bacterium]|nr:CYTH domain-containing protein [Pseudomonadota bacterium]
MSLEQEVKLVVNTTHKIDLRTLSFLAPMTIGELETHHLVSTYFDTPDKYLSGEKIGLRMRKFDDAWWQTVKTAGVVKDGLHQREEWEFALDGPEWDLSTLRKTPLLTMIDEPKLWSQLAPLFTTDFMRDTLQLKLADNSLVELAYDYGQVIAGDKTSSIHELELELKSGNVDALMLIASKLQAQLDVMPSDCSKAQMGYELASR